MMMMMKRMKRTKLTVMMMMQKIEMRLTRKVTKRVECKLNRDHTEVEFADDEHWRLLLVGHLIAHCLAGVLDMSFDSETSLCMGSYGVGH